MFFCSFRSRQMLRSIRCGAMMMRTRSGLGAKWVAVLRKVHAQSKG
jgi:hypothetical protein